MIRTTSADALARRAVALALCFAAIAGLLTGGCSREATDTLTWVDVDPYAIGQEAVGVQVVLDKPGSGLSFDTLPAGASLRPAAPGSETTRAAFTLPGSSLRVALNSAEQPYFVESRFPVCTICVPFREESSTLSYVKALASFRLTAPLDTALARALAQDRSRTVVRVTHAGAPALDALVVSTGTRAYAIEPADGSGRYTISLLSLVSPSALEAVRGEIRAIASAIGAESVRFEVARAKQSRLRWVRPSSPNRALSKDDLERALTWLAERGIVTGISAKDIESIVAAYRPGGGMWLTPIRWQRDDEWDYASGKL